MMDDRQLLERYVAEASDEAFRELVRRHMGLVYAAALRQVRDPQRAQDVTQMVFANLARKARTIPHGMTLAGWLHRDTRFTALDFLRAEVRRTHREQQAVAMNALNSEPSHDWEKIRPLLDEALDELGPEDRDALLLRYFEERDYAGVGAALGASAEAARKRVERALDRLREYLVKRGITTTATALSAVLSAHAIEAVPAGLATALLTTSAAVAAQAAAPAVSGWLSNLFLMTNTKLAVGAVVVVAALSTPFVVQQNAIAKARTEQSALSVHEQSLPAQVDSTAQSTTGVSEPDRTQRDWADLERLRSESATLRSRISDLTAQADRLVAARSASATKSSGSPGVTPIGQTIRTADARDVGQATPAALMQTFVWALAHGDTNRLGQLLAISPMTDLKGFERMWKEFEVAAAQAAASGSGMIATPIQIHLVEEQLAENNDRWIVVQEVKDDGRVAPASRGRVTWTDTGWRLLVGTNGQAIGEPIRPAH